MKGSGCPVHPHELRHLHVKTLIDGGLPELNLTPTEYATGGRYFQSTEMSEGEEVTMSVIDLLGEDILMYASDYPHGESWFPISVDTVMGWTGSRSSLPSPLSL